ncbi:Zinc finger BED domain-containing protein 4 [Frankliniella fusca]|uniref:Zinc finger BED domain-containing protein 4 n=1 Tax=Frankliniella fusca TaxID=407009 RepID=A0AAE1HJL5_9NEOP|nr:Zinc finger BED domain-containing protein 4 [Frankliniella fusca]
MPLSVTERKGFRFFCKSLQPLYHLPSEPTVTKRLRLKHDELKALVSKMLGEAESISLTCDIWTHQSTMRSYLGVTAHFRDDIEIVGIELCCKHLTDRKNIPNLRASLREVCAEWGITYDKISVVVSDGGANIKGAIREEFGVLKHVTCIAHLINGVGQAAVGLDKYVVPSERDRVEELPDNEDEIDDHDDDGTPENGEFLRGLIKKVKKIVRFFRQSEIANSELLKIQSERAGKPDHQCLRLIQEVRTRWNSCYQMLDRFLLLADHVSQVLLKIQREKSSKARPPNFPTGEELEALSEARDLLKPLYQVTLEVSKEKSVTLSICIPLVAAMKRKTDAFVPTTPIGFNLKSTLQEEIKTKFSGIENLKPYTAATVLDPRFKTEGFSNSRNQIQVKANATSYVGQLVAAEINKGAVTLAEALGAAEGEGPPADGADDGLWAEFDSNVRAHAPLAHQDVAGGLPVEWRQYLNSSLAGRKENPNALSVWKVMKDQYPHVYKVAMRHLCAMATSVPSERLFSHAGLIATQLRNRLSGKNLDMLVFLRSVPEKLWLT